MSDDENSPPSTIGQKRRQGALRLGPRKKAFVLFSSVPWILYVQGHSNYVGRCGTDPLVHHGRHFGRTVHALSSISALINNGILRMGELADQPEETFTSEYFRVIFYVRLKQVAY
jgi:hypothetical protein